MKTHRRLRTWGWTIGVVVSAAIVAAFMSAILRQDAKITLRRYVGPMLPDGSRITFLYPSDLQARAWPARQFGAYFSTRGLYWNISRLRLPYVVDNEAIIVSYFPPPTGIALTSNPTRLVRSDVSAEAIYGRAIPPGISHHLVALRDERGQERFQFDHICNARRKDRFEALDAKIAASFQVLPAGANVPMQ